MIYNILRTDKAEEQLREIFFYVADDSSSVDIAFEYLDKIETAINRLHEFFVFGLYSQIFNYKKARVSSGNC